MNDNDLFRLDVCAYTTTSLTDLKYYATHSDFYVRNNTLHNDIATEEIQLLVKARNKIDRYEIPYVFT